MMRIVKGRLKVEGGPIGDRLPRGAPNPAHGPYLGVNPPYPGGLLYSPPAPLPAHWLPWPLVGWNSRINFHGSVPALEGERGSTSREDIHAPRYTAGPADAATSHARRAVTQARAAVATARLPTPHTRASW